MPISTLILSISEVFGHPEPQVNLLPGEALVVSFSGKAHHWMTTSIDLFDRLSIVPPSPAHHSLSVLSPQRIFGVWSLTDSTSTLPLRSLITECLRWAQAMDLM